MYSVIVGWSPHTGHSGFFLIRTSWKSVESASNRRRRPISGSPTSSASFSASFVWRVPTIPGRPPSTPPSAHDGASSGGGGADAAVARAVTGLEDRDLTLEAVDRAVDDRDVVPDRGVVHEVARREVVGAVDDHLPAVGKDPLDVLGAEPLAVGRDLHVGVQRLDRAPRTVDLRRAERVQRVRDLPLEVRLVDDVRVDDPDVSHSG